MFKRILKQIKYRMMARQLRRPSGGMGNKVGGMMNKANSFLYDSTLSVMQPGDGDQILEIGFGNGKFFDRIFSAASNLRVRGIDFSSTMVKAAQQNNQEAISGGRLELISGSSEAMPFADGSFDKIFCINVVYFWDNPQTHLQEIKRVLKPGGKFYVTIRTRESMEKMPFTRFGFKKYSRETWEAQVTAAGFRFENEVVIQEPIVEFEENPFNIMSICLVAVKPHLKD